MTETEVYQAVAKLFHDEEDLMFDFKTYLPDVGTDVQYKQHQLENLAKIEQSTKPFLQENNENISKKRTSETQNPLFLPKVLFFRFFF